MAPERRSLLFGLAIALLVALTIGLNVASSKSASSATSDQALVGAVLSTKIALWGRELSAAAPGPDVSASYEEMALTSLERAAEEGTPNERAKALRRLAILRSSWDRPNAEEALGRLAAIDANDRLPAPADEVDLLRSILVGGPISAADRPLLEARLGELSLGWFDHLLRARLLRRSGDDAGADDALSEARAQATVTVLAMFAFGGALLGGGIAWLVVLATGTRRRVLDGLRAGFRRPPLPAATRAVLLGTFASYLGWSLVVWTLVRRIPLPLAEGPTGRAALLVASEVLIAALTYGVFRALRGREGPRLAEMGFRRANLLADVGTGVVAYLLLLPLLLVVIVPLAALFERLGIPSQSHPIVDAIQAGADAPLSLVLLFVVAAVQAPLVEETLFRGTLYPALRGRVGGLAAALLASFIFAALHPQLGLGLLGVFLIGFILTLVYELTGSLVASATAHALNNAVLLAIAMALFSK